MYYILRVVRKCVQFAWLSDLAYDPKAGSLGSLALPCFALLIPYKFIYLFKILTQCLLPKSPYYNL